MYRIESPLDLSELMELAALDRPDLKDEPWLSGRAAAASQARRPTAALFDEIRRGDILVHQPYDSYRASFEIFAQAAAQDPDVIVMKTAVYRTSDDSVLVELAHPVRRGGQAVRLPRRAQGAVRRAPEHRVVARARAGGSPRRRTAIPTEDPREDDAVVRREGGVLRRYAHIGTGNYHAATARLYEDVGIFTADEDVTADVAELFNFITGFGRPQQFRKLLVAPFTLRAASSTRSAAFGTRPPPARWLVSGSSWTMSSIPGSSTSSTPPHSRERPSTSSRGPPALCVPEWRACRTTSASARSSAGTWSTAVCAHSMRAKRRRCTWEARTSTPRNLDHRIEVLVPIENARVRQELNAILDSALGDNSNAWELDANGAWTRLVPTQSEKPRSHQATMMRRALSRARRRAREPANG